MSNVKCGKRSESEAIGRSGWILFGNGYFEASSVVGINVDSHRLELLLDGGHTLYSMYSTTEDAFEAREDLLVAIAESKKRRNEMLVKLSRKSGSSSDKPSAAIRREIARHYGRDVGARQ